jgi:transposase
MMDSSREVAESGTTDMPRRRRHPIAEKRRMVEESLAPGASVARVARAHGVNANQVFAWRRLYQRGLLGGKVCTTALLPVTVSDAEPHVRLARNSNTAAAQPPAVSPGTIQLQLPKGRLCIEGAADTAALRVVLECLLG